MASSKVRIKVHSDGLDGFIARGRARARALDRGEELPAEHIITFRTPGDMFQVLTPRRFDILQALANTGTQPVSSLAVSLRRNRSAVSRDLRILTRVGAVCTKSVSNTGHGRMTLASPVASRLEIVSVIGRGKRPTPRSKAS
jgi:predicted transcriptional regulator